MNPSQQLEAFAQAKVLLVGDAMLDAYYWGSVTRQSPEAPVPVLQVERTEHRLGGAANVALNLRSLGAEVYLCCTAAHDGKGEIFRQLVAEAGVHTDGILAFANRPTTVKTRVIKGTEHLLRVDEEVTHDLSTQEEKQFLDAVLALANRIKPQVILFQDYNKGVLTVGVIETLVRWAKSNGVPTVVDPKKKNFLAYQGVTLFKPNLKEIREGLGVAIDPVRPESLETAVTTLREQLQATAILCTLSEHGAYLQWTDGAERQPAFPRKIVDVSGAGDTVVSVAALVLATGGSMHDVLTWSNLAGGLVCEEVGVVPIQPEQLRVAVENM